LIVKDDDKHREIERALTLLSVIESLNHDIARLNEINQHFINQIKDVGDERIKQYLSEQLKNIEEDSA
jgi:SMC interacting uncharacterized protein involved in chromosome segregation